MRPTAASLGLGILLVLLVGTGAGLRAAVASAPAGDQTAGSPGPIDPDCDPSAAAANEAPPADPRPTEEPDAEDGDDPGFFVGSASE